MNRLIDIGVQGTSTCSASTQRPASPQLAGGLLNADRISFRMDVQQSHSTPLVAAPALRGRISAGNLGALDSLAGGSGSRPGYLEGTQESFRPTSGSVINVMSNQGPNAGSVVTPAGDGSCRVAIPKCLPAGSMDNVHVLAIKDTCAYIKQVVANFNAQVDTFPAEAQQDIRDLNTYIQNVSLRDEPSGCGPGSIPEVDTWAWLPQNRRETKTPVQPVAGPEAVPARRRGASGKASRVLFRESHESQSDQSSEEGAPVGRQQSCSREASVLSMPELVAALNRLDSRTYPKPEPFDSASGVSFDEFLLEFEEYCSNTFRGGSDRWIGELGRYLKGEMRAVFLTQKIPGDSYQAVKTKLRKWLKDSKEIYESDTKQRFKKAQWQPSESMWLYASRLEQPFRMAYPSKSVDSSKT